LTGALLDGRIGRRVRKLELVSGRGFGERARQLESVVADARARLCEGDGVESVEHVR
jgi:hypothetical protein